MTDPGKQGDKNERNIQRLKEALRALSGGVDRNADAIEAVLQEMHQGFDELDATLQYLIDETRHSYRKLSEEIDDIKKTLDRNGL